MTRLRELEPGAEGMTVNGSNERLAGVCQPSQKRGQRPDQL
jgi:hypothetical protein